MLLCFSLSLLINIPTKSQMERKENTVFATRGFVHIGGGFAGGESLVVLCLCVEIFFVLVHHLLQCERVDESGMGHGQK